MQVTLKINLHDHFIILSLIVLLWISSFISNNSSKFLNSGHSGRINQKDSFFMENRRPIPTAFLQWAGNGSGFLSATIRHEIILVSNFKYLFFDEFIAKSCESYRKIVFYEKSVNFLDLYKKSLHQYIPTYKIIMGFEVVVS
uniref:Uncharacterized protein n=1 Tax=Heterorhabditis bacteriophora TaxID=37862 RepID=A0A1I7WZ31_HETBA